MIEKWLKCKLKFIVFLFLSFTTFFTGLLDAACERQLTNLEMGP